MVEFGTWVYRNGELVRKGGPLDVRPVVARSELPRPMVISDSLDYVVNPLDGRAYTSKAQYYRTVKANGCEILGNDKITPRDNDAVPDGEVERSVAQAFDQVG